MKLRKFLFGGALTLAIGASFAFKPLLNDPATTPITGMGITLCMSGYTDQPSCAPQFTGPACTMTYQGISGNTAYAPNSGVPQCTVVLHQPH